MTEPEKSAAKATKKSNHLLFYGVTTLVIFLAGALLSAGCAPEEDAPSVERAVAVRYVAASRGDLHKTLPYVGTVRFDRTVRVSSQIPGVLDEQLSAEGAIVQRGDQLGRILAPELANRVAQVKAEIRRARTERDFVCSTLQTDERLGESGAIEPIHVATTRKNCASATEAVRAAEARGAEVRTARGRTVEQAPEDGQILRWLVEPGEYVGPGKPLVMVGTGPRLVTVRVAEPDLRRGIEVGTGVVLRSGDEEARTSVSYVSPSMTGPSRSTTVEALLPDTLTLPDGASVDVEFLTDSATNVLIVPERALARDDKGSFVFVADDGNARRIDVTTGLHARGLVEVSGLPDDAHVITTQIRSLSEGTPLFVVEAPR